MHNLLYLLEGPSEKTSSLLEISPLLTAETADICIAVEAEADGVFREKSLLTGGGRRLSKRTV